MSKDSPSCYYTITQRGRVTEVTQDFSTVILSLAIPGTQAFDDRGHPLHRRKA